MFLQYKGSWAWWNISAIWYKKGLINILSTVNTYTSTLPLIANQGYEIVWIIIVSSHCIRHEWAKCSHQKYVQTASCTEPTLSSSLFNSEQSEAIITSYWTFGGGRGCGGGGGGGWAPWTTYSVLQLCLNAWQLKLIVWLTRVCLDDGPTFKL